MTSFIAGAIVGGMLGAILSGVLLRRYRHLLTPPGVRLEGAECTGEF